MNIKEEILLERAHNGDVQAMLDFTRNIMKFNSLNMIKINSYLSNVRELDLKLGCYLSGQYYLIQAIHNPQLKTYFEIGFDYLQKAADLGHVEAKAILESIRK